MSARAGIVVTGTEVLTGRVADANGPWLAEVLRGLGVDVAHTVVVGDRRADLLAALGFVAGAGTDLVVTTGGLGPTADDLTAEVVAQFQGRPLRLDAELQGRIAAIADRLAARRSRPIDADATAAATRKQALVPEGSAVLEPVGTAPGLVVLPAPGRGGPPVLVLPGPPNELQGMWPAAAHTDAVRAVLAGRDEIRQSTLRLWGTSEPELAATLREHEAALGDLEITTCLRDGELEVVTRYGPAAQPAYDAFAATIALAHPDTLFSPDGRTIDELVAARLSERGLTIATAESCTAGLLAARLADRPGSSAYLQGGAVSYVNAVKEQVLGVPAETIAAVGAVSAEVAEAMAAGARSRFGTDVGVGVTGVAGPGGGSPDKPVGLVHLCAAGPDGSLARRVVLPGSRADVRRRATTVALHLLRRLLS